MKNRFLRTHQLDESLAPWMAVAVEVPPGGWLRAIREGLGLTTRQAAARARIVPSAWIAAEQGEAAGTISLGHLRKLAAALGCELRYATVPSEPLAERVRKQADTVARKRLQGIAHSMRLEAQSTDDGFQTRQTQALADELLGARWSELWKQE